MAERFIFPEHLLSVSTGLLSRPSAEFLVIYLVYTVVLMFRICMMLRSCSILYYRPHHSTISYFCRIRGILFCNVSFKEFV